jgi:hypothetical protein
MELKIDLASEAARARPCGSAGLAGSDFFRRLGLAFLEMELEDP